MRALAAIAAVSLALAAPASAAQASMPAWLKDKVSLVANGLGEYSPRITRIRLNVREHGKLVDHVWARGSFTCRICSPMTNTHLDVIYDARSHSLLAMHVWN